MTASQTLDALSPPEGIARGPAGNNGALLGLGGGRSSEGGIAGSIDGLLPSKEGHSDEHSGSPGNHLEGAAPLGQERAAYLSPPSAQELSDREICRDNLRLFERLAARDGAARWQVSIDHWAAAVAGYEWRAVDFSYGDDDGMVAWLNRSGGLEFLQWPGDDGAWLRPEAAAVRLGVTAERLQELVWWADSEAAAGV